VRLVADANVLLSAVIGGRAVRALRHNEVEQVLTPTTAYDEVFEYLPSLAKKKRLDLDTLLLACAALPVTVVERSEYKASWRRPGAESASAIPTTLMCWHLRFN
jgi:predicted nucleic acid-binding protein